MTVMVEDAAQPALFSVMAGTLAAEQQLPLICVRGDWSTRRFPDARQHVLAGGGLATSGLLWPERLSGCWLAPEVVPADALTLPADCVVATPPQQLATVLERLQQQAHRWQLWRIRRQGEERQLVAEDGLRIGEPWRQDTFGRWWRATSRPEVAASR